MPHKLECLGPPYTCHRKKMGCRSHGQNRVYHACSCTWTKLPQPWGSAVPRSSRSLRLSVTKRQSSSGRAEISRLPWKSTEVESAKHFPRVTWHSASWSCTSLSFIYLSFACWPPCWEKPGAYSHWGFSESLQHEDVVMTPQSKRRCTRAVIIRYAKPKLLFIVTKAWGQAIACCSFAGGCQIKVLVKWQARIYNKIL